MEEPRRITSIVGRRSQRRLGDRGSVAVEAALIFPLLIMLTFGIIEFSLLMRDHVATTSVVRAGARTASALPRNTDMINETKLAVEKAGSALPKDSYEELWIYKANAAGYPGEAAKMADATCGAATNCVKFTWNDSRDAFNKLSGGWQAASIDACPGMGVNGRYGDAVGVYLKAKHTWLTGLFKNETTVADRAVLKFEPVTDTPCEPA